MSIDKLSPNHIFQKEDDDNCGPTCIAMIYKMFGKRIGIVHILKDLRIKKKGRTTFPPELAEHLLNNNIQTKLIISSPRIVSPAWADVSRKKLIENLIHWMHIQKSHNEKGYKYAKLLISYLKKGGTAELTSYTVETMKTMLDRGSLLIVCVDEVWLLGHRFLRHKAEVDEFTRKTLGHYVLVSGYLGDEFVVYDPYPTGLPNRHGVYKMNQNQLLNASLIWAATILQVQKS